MNPARGVRLVAVFEGAKGALILLAGFGLLALVHRDLQDIAERLVHRFHLNPARHYPRIFLEVAGKANNTRLWPLVVGASLYAALRFVEAYGLWRERRWAGWFAACSGALYLPLEIAALCRSISWPKVATLLINLSIVSYMAWALWRSEGFSPHSLEPEGRRH